MKECINCGRPVTDQKEIAKGIFGLCPSCISAEDEMTKLLEEGLEIEFLDTKTGKTVTEIYKK